MPKVKLDGGREVSNIFEFNRWFWSWNKRLRVFFGIKDFSAYSETYKGAQTITYIVTFDEKYTEIELGYIIYRDTENKIIDH